MDYGLGGGATELRRLVDEEIVAHARQGNTEAAEYLLSKYKWLVEGKARSYFLAGADHEDVVQEGMIGLYKAIRDFRTDKLAGFRAFAEICVTRQIITAVKSASRQKHTPLNRCVSLHAPSMNGEQSTALIDVLPDKSGENPEKYLVETDIVEYIENCNDTGLSSLEKSVFSFYAQGMTYDEIAKLVSRHPKSVDNALQRAKRKISAKIKRN